MKSLAGLSIILLFLVTSSCTSKIASSQQKKYPPLNSQQEVKVFAIGQIIPRNSELIEKLSTGEKGFKADINYDIVIRQAKFFARKAGGNAIQIIDYTAPSALVSPKHRMTINILSIPVDENVYRQEEITTIPNINYAILHIYRYGGPGFAVNYNLVLGDSTICKVKNNFSTTIQIKKEGRKTIWAQTEARSFVIVDFKFGREYFLRCGIVEGSVVGIPKLELVNTMTGKSEMEYFK